MKRQLIVLSAVLAMSLSGCGGREQTEESSAAPATQPAATAPVETAPPLPVPDVPETPAVTPEQEEPESAGPDSGEMAAGEPEDAGRPSDVEILDAYYEALEAYSWFTEGGDEGLELDESDETVQEDMVFYRVTRPGLEDLDHLRSYLKDLFSDEVVDTLMEDTSRFLETERGLYARPSAAAEGGRGPLMLMVLWPDEGQGNACTVQAVVEQDSEERVHEVPYQKVGEKWVLTDFGPIF